MRIIVSCFIFIAAMTCAAYAAGYADVLYLKNGGKAKGVIVENEINAFVKLEARDGSVTVYRYAEIEKITREKIDTSGTEAENRRMLMAYEGAKKSWWTGTGLSCLLLPGLGHMYVQEYAYGAMYLGLDLALLGGSLYFSYGRNGNLGTGLFYALLASRLIELVHLDYAVDNYNRKIRETLGIGQEVSFSMKYGRAAKDGGGLIFAACEYRF